MILSLNSIIKVHNQVRYHVTSLHVTLIVRKHVWSHFWVQLIEYNPLFNNLRN
jgi:hypothetical protein